MTTALITLGALSAAYSVYRGIKQDKQVERANTINENAAQLSYQSQKETNEMNYKIFKDQQQYNSPENLKSMYDSLGLNGSAIVANQGFTPTDAPQMIAPTMPQVAELPYQTQQNPADTMMNALITALSSSKMQAEIKKITNEAIQVEAQTENCRQSTELILKQIYGEDLRNKLTENDVNMINEKNAELRLTIDKLEQEVQFNQELMPRIMRQYDDKHLLDAIEKELKDIQVEYDRKTLKTKVAILGQQLRSAIKNNDKLDLDIAIGEIAKDIQQYNLRYTEDTYIERVNAENSSNRVMSKQNRNDEARIDKNDPDKFTGKMAATVGAIVDGVAAPLRGIFKIGK